jgi:predicted ATPase/DNA-binding CsgD family transcriptional regulator
VARGDRTGGRHHPDIPLLPAPLIGRRAEIAAARDFLLGGARLVTLTGPPGVGKTSLALALAADLGDRFADGACFIDLSAVTDADLVAATVADALGATGRRRPVERLIAILRRCEMLLLLDNFEQVVSAAPVIAELLAACPQLTVVVTSRVPLRLRWEHELPVPPLQLPDPAGPGTAAAVGTAPAVRLFVERARAVSPAFALVEENAPTIGELCARLDGLPLAIELAAARIRLLTPAAMLRQLAGAHARGDVSGNSAAGALGLLTDGPRDLPARQQTLREAIAWSYALLTPSEQRLFRRLAVFVGGATLAAVEQICEAGWPEMASLVEKSLLRQEAPLSDDAGEDGTETRVRMLEMVREYALEQLQASDEADELRRRHTAYYLGLAERAQPGLFGPNQDQWLGHLDREHDNLRAVERRAVQLGDAETELRLGAALQRYWYSRDDAAEARARVDNALALARRMPPRPASARVLHGTGAMARFLGDYEASRSLLEMSLLIAREIDDRSGIVNALLDLARLAFFQDRHDDGRAQAEEGLTIARELGDRSAIAGALYALGFVSFREGDTVRARAAYDQALPIYRQLGDWRGISDVLYVTGLCLQVEGALDAARTLFEESVAIDRALGHQRSMAITLQALAHVLVSLGDLQAARRHYHESLIAARETGDRRRLAFIVSAAGALAAAMGDSERAIRLDAAGLAVVNAMGVRIAPPSRALYDEQLAPAKAILGADGVLAAEAAGRAMTLEQAVDEALSWLADPAGQPMAAGSPAREDTIPAQTTETEPATRGAERRLPMNAPALTRREREVAVLLTRGCTNRQIAGVLVISERTAGTYVQRVMNRLGLHNRAQVAVWAVEHGLHEQASPRDQAR